MKILTLTLLLSFISSISHASLALQCPLSSSAKSLILESVIRNRLEAAWIVSNSEQSSFPSRAFSRNLVGSTSAFTGIFTLIEQCTGPRTFDKFCEPCEENNCPIDIKCSQLACEAANIDTATLWWQPAPFRYTSDQPAFPNISVRYARIPKTVIRYDGTNPGLLKISWTANDFVSAKFQGSRQLDTSSSLTANAQRTPTGPQFAQVHIMYPFVSNTQEVTNVDFKIDSRGVLSGSVLVGKSAVGKILEAAGEEVARIEWIERCAE